MRAPQLLETEGRIVEVYRIKRGGRRTTEDVVHSTVHTSSDVHINSESFPLIQRPEEEQLLVAFQIPRLAYDPKGEEFLSELKKFGLALPTYEDALKFDEAYPNEQGFFLFLHEPWLGPNYRFVIYLHRKGSLRELNLGWLDYRWNRYAWVVGVPPKNQKTERIENED